MSLTFPSTSTWPPAPYDRMMDAMRIWSAWWAGDPDELSYIYSVEQKMRRAKYSRNRTTVAEGAEEYFWGLPNSEGTRRRHVSAAASVARASASLLFSKAPRISPAGEDAKNERLVARVQEIFGPEAYGGSLISAAELASALGGVYLRPWWDKSVVGHVVPSHVAANCAIPEFRFDRLIAVTFWNVLSEEGASPVVRHLERHEKGKIYHSLYHGTESTLGEKQDLDCNPATAWVVPMANADGAIDTQLDRLDVVYVPNVLPNRTWHNIPGLAALGRSDFDGIEGEFDALDEVYTSWMRDVEDGKSRMFVSEDAIEDQGPGNGGSFDREKRLYTEMKTGMGSALDGGQMLQDIKFDIRWSEHANSIAEVKQHILEHVGISAQHFADGPLAVGVTATAVSSQNSITETTRAAKLNFWHRALSEFVQIVMDLDAIHFATGMKMTEAPEIRFTAQHLVSEDERSRTIATKRGAGVMSRYEGVKQANPDWTEPAIVEELERIREDSIFDTKLAFGQAPGMEDGEDPDMEGTEGVPADEEGTMELDDMAMITQGLS